MKHDQSTQNRKSLGALYKAKKTKERSPILTGQLKLQRHTFAAIGEQFDRGDDDEVVCNIAAWENVARHGEPYLTVELSPRFMPKRRPKEKLFGWLSHDG
jgi:hypothetical protein